MKTNNIYTCPCGNCGSCPYAGEANCPGMQLGDLHNRSLALETELSLSAPAQRPSIMSALAYVAEKASAMRDDIIKSRIYIPGIV